MAKTTKGAISAAAIWVTREWGRNWIGCVHGQPSNSTTPVRICQECFDTVMNNAKAEKQYTHEEMVTFCDEARDQGRRGEE